MFYLTKRIDEKQCTVGELCMVLADFSGVPAGTKGRITEVYTEGVMVEWHDLPKGRQSWQKPLADGFGRDELQYLAFATEKRPDVSAHVYLITEEDFRQRIAI